jgi:hypothetical protein
MTAAVVAQTSESLGLDIMDALAGEPEFLTDFLQGVFAFPPDPESQSDDSLLFKGEGGQNIVTDLEIG